MEIGFYDILSVLFFFAVAFIFYNEMKKEFSEFIESKLKKYLYSSIAFGFGIIAMIFVAILLIIILTRGGV